VPATTETVTVTAQPEPAADETEIPEEAGLPKPRDFQIAVLIREKKCFGSAGCSLTIQIKPRYLGPLDLTGGYYDVTYEVRGGTDGPMVNTFTLEDGTASFDEEEYLDTASSGSKISARVTAVYEQ